MILEDISSDAVNSEEIEDLFDIFEPLELEAADLIFWPVNDNTGKI